jgi:hypothetical protein
LSATGEKFQDAVLGKVELVGVVFVKLENNRAEEGFKRWRSVWAVMLMGLRGTVGVVVSLRRVCGWNRDGYEGRSYWRSWNGTGWYGLWSRGWCRSRWGRIYRRCCYCLRGLGCLLSF